MNQWYACDIGFFLHDDKDAVQYQGKKEMVVWVLRTSMYTAVFFTAGLLNRKTIEHNELICIQSIKLRGGLELFYALASK